MKGCTISNNVAQVHSGGMYIQHCGSTLIEDSKFVGNLVAVPLNNLEKVQFVTDVVAA